MWRQKGNPEKGVSRDSEICSETWWRLLCSRVSDQNANNINQDSSSRLWINSLRQRFSIWNTNTRIRATKRASKWAAKSLRHPPELLPVLWMLLRASMASIKSSFVIRVVALLRYCCWIWMNDWEMRWLL